jgi:DNA-binding Xre family transcriptional regulator
VYWNLRVLMAERDIRDATSLHAMLVPLGYRRTVSHLRRLIYKLPVSINSELLGMLCRALDVETNEIVARMPESVANARPILVPKQPAESPAKAMERLLGPPTPALPKGKFRAR